MNLVKGDRVFEVFVKANRLMVKEGDQEAYVRDPKDSKVLNFVKPNPSILFNGKPLTGLSLTKEQSEEITQMYQDWLEAHIQNPDIIKFSYGDNFEVRPFTKLSPSLIAKLNMLNTGVQTGWLRENATNVKGDKGIHFEIALALVEEEAEKRQSEKAASAAAIEGAIAFNRCWECGVARIVGKIVNGKAQEMPYDEYVVVKAAFAKAWKAQFTDDAIRSSVGLDWQKLFAEEGYRAVIVSKNYCGC